ncbi:MAG: prepilin peptidase [Planctomycetaceae bacterium]|nr:prepilin peptidase [Planctomycetaceae bacterium]
MDWSQILFDHWHVKVVSAILILAAWIDGKELRVPNWITFPMVLSGLVYSTCVGGLGGLGAGLMGMCVGLLTLLPLYSVGGMGAGDVKLMAGIGAWLGWKVTLLAFCVSVIVGAVMAVLMVLWSRKAKHHYSNFLMILSEWMVIRNPVELSRIAAERKPTMALLPYGIPICIGSIGYFIYAGMM